VNINAIHNIPLKMRKQQQNIDYWKNMRVWYVLMIQKENIVYNFRNWHVLEALMGGGGGGGGGWGYSWWAG
jgi:hypothetical protein